MRDNIVKKRFLTLCKLVLFIKYHTYRQIFQGLTPFPDVRLVHEETGVFQVHMPTPPDNYNKYCKFSLLLCEIEYLFFKHLNLNVWG